MVDAGNVVCLQKTLNDDLKSINNDSKEPAAEINTLRQRVLFIKRKDEG